jgi:hypothetical protein
MTSGSWRTRVRGACSCARAACARRGAVRRGLPARTARGTPFRSPPSSSAQTRVISGLNCVFAPPPTRTALHTGGVASVGSTCERRKSVGPHGEGNARVPSRRERSRRVHTQTCGLRRSRPHCCGARGTRRRCRPRVGHAAPQIVRRRGHAWDEVLGDARSRSRHLRHPSARNVDAASASSRAPMQGNALAIAAHRSWRPSTPRRAIDGILAGFVAFCVDAASSRHARAGCDRLVARVDRVARYDGCPSKGCAPRAPPLRRRGASETCRLLLTSNVRVSSVASSPRSS